MTDDRHDPALAALHARQRPREKGAAPHYLRCDWYRGEQRCQLAEGHFDAHKYGEAS